MQDVWKQVSKALEGHGIEFRIDSQGTDPANCTVICLSGDMNTTVTEMGRTSRDKVVMVRIDEDTKTNLDEWVKTGAVKSRSEAAALFIREGIRVRASELDQLREALVDVDTARQRLEEKAREVIGREPADERTPE